MFEIKNNRQSATKILIVEDDQTNKQLLKIYLNQNYTVNTAASAEEAVESVKKNLYDLILMDINLGAGKNGIQAAKEIRELPGYNSVPIVAMTAFSKIEISDFFCSEDRDYYLEKPYFKVQLLEVIYKALKQKV